MTWPADNSTSHAAANGERTLVDLLLQEQHQLTAVETFARAHERHELTEPRYRTLLPATAPRTGEQYAFEVNLDQCSGCKACVTACHSLNGLDDGEAWREVGALFGEVLVPAGSSRRAEAPSEVPSDAPERGRPRPQPRAADVSVRAPTASPDAQRASVSLAPTGREGWGEGAARARKQSDFSFARNIRIPVHQTVTTACHHCIEPGCLEGCPVLAYDKDPLTGIVRHLDDQCIGCSYCILKCPYDVPKYSASRGIVRKCDMCHGRLAVGEAPACVQACPNEAIRISVVNTAAVTATFRTVSSGAGEKVGKRESVTASVSPSHFPSPSLSHLPSPWLPDSPSPRITLPTTRYVTTKPAADLRSADHNQPRPQPTHWPLILMLVLTQAGIGGLLAARLTNAKSLPLELTSLTLLFAGLTASVFHLGQPLKAWRVWLGWRTSWLSREAMLLNAFAGIAVASIAARWLPLLTNYYLLITLVVAAVGFAAVFAQAMVYADTHRTFWSLPRTASRFLGSIVVLGLSLSLVAEVLSPLRGLGDSSASASTGSAALHPWLLSAAPVGAETGTRGTKASENGVAPSAHKGRTGADGVNADLGETSLGARRVGPDAHEVAIFHRAAATSAHSPSSEGAPESSHGWSAAKPVDSGANGNSPRRGDGTSLIATVLLFTTLLKLAGELAVLKHADSDRWTQLRRTAALQTGALRPVLATRLLAALVGSVFIPFTIITGGATAALAISAFTLCLFGELAERYLFFTSVAPDKMPV